MVICKHMEEMVYGLEEVEICSNMLVEVVENALVVVEVTYNNKEVDLTF